MAKFTKQNLNSGFASTDSINQNFTDLETFSDTCLTRDGTTPNAMAAQLDMGLNRIINVDDPVELSDAVNLRYANANFSNVGNAATEAIAAAANAAQSETNAAASEAAAAASAASAASDAENLTTGVRFVSPVATASGGETSLALSESVYAGQFDVFLNGSKLLPGTDYDDVTGTSVTGLAALTAGDEVQVQGWGLLTDVNVLNASNNLSDLDDLVLARSNLGLGTAAVQNSNEILQVDNNLSDLASASTARTNLGLGDVATLNAGTGVSASGSNLNLDINELSTDTPVAGDTIAFYDASTTSVKKTTVAALGAATSVGVAVILEQHPIGSVPSYRTSGWNIRRLNTINGDPSGIVTSLTSNQFTLGAGTYLINAAAIAVVCQNHNIRLYNVTDSSVVLEGMPGESDTAGFFADSKALLTCIISPSSSKTYRLEHKTQAGGAGALTMGYGDTSVINAQVIITKIG